MDALTAAKKARANLRGSEQTIESNPEFAPKAELAAAYRAEKARADAAESLVDNLFLQIGLVLG